MNAYQFYCLKYSERRECPINISTRYTAELHVFRNPAAHKFDFFNCFVILWLKNGDFLMSRNSIGQKW